MKKRTILLLLALLTISISIVINNSCATLGKNDPVIVIHKSAMPYFRAIDTATIDSIMSTRVGMNTAEEMVVR